MTACSGVDAVCRAAQIEDAFTRKASHKVTQIPQFDRMQPSKSVGSTIKELLLSSDPNQLKMVGKSGPVAQILGQSDDI
jgi:hypothetical protein